MPKIKGAQTGRGSEKKWSSNGSNGTAVFQCHGFGDCRMVFTRSEHLARHIRKHTGERPFQCHCMKSFSRLDNLRQHCQTVHSDTPERNEEVLRKLTVLHANLAASAAKNQKAQVKNIPDTASKQGDDAADGRKSMSSASMGTDLGASESTRIPIQNYPKTSEKLSYPDYSLPDIPRRASQGTPTALPMIPYHRSRPASKLGSRGHPYLLLPERVSPTSTSPTFSRTGNGYSMDPSSYRSSSPTFNSSRFRLPSDKISPTSRLPPLPTISYAEASSCPDSMYYTRWSPTSSESQSERFLRLPSTSMRRYSEGSEMTRHFPSTSSRSPYSASPTSPVPLVDGEPVTPSTPWASSDRLFPPHSLPSPNGNDYPTKNTRPSIPSPNVYFPSRSESSMKYESKYDTYAALDDYHQIHTSLPPRGATHYRMVDISPTGIGLPPPLSLSGRQGYSRAYEGDKARSSTAPTSAEKSPRQRASVPDYSRPYAFSGGHSPYSMATYRNAYVHTGSYDRRTRTIDMD
ncbi:Up in starvation [Malassezia pachydermatis]